MLSVFNSLPSPTLYFGECLVFLVEKVLLSSIGAKSIYFEDVKLKSSRDYIVTKEASSYYQIKPTFMLPWVKFSNSPILTQTASILRYFAAKNKANKYLKPLPREEKYLVLAKTVFFLKDSQEKCSSWTPLGKKYFLNKVKKVKSAYELLWKQLRNNNYIIVSKFSVLLLKTKSYSKTVYLSCLKNLKRCLPEMKKKLV